MATAFLIVFSLVSLILIPWFLLAPVVVFLVKPSSPFWIKELKIIFLWLSFVLSSYFVFGPLVDHVRVVPALTFFWIVSNTYVGWWEFLWRYKYKQLSWSWRKNLQYSPMSNVCILLSMLSTILLALFLVGTIFVLPIFSQ